MNRTFAPLTYFTVPDGTDVSAFLNATDSSQSDLPWGALGEMSVAAGRIRPRSRSAVHVHPVVTQVTYVVSGDLTIRMRDAGAPEHYDLVLGRGQAALSRPGTLFQLRNEADALVEVLYLASPSYVFCMDESRGVIYDDAVMVAATWEEVAPPGPDRPTTTEILGRRAEAIRCLAARRGQEQ